LTYLKSKYINCKVRKDNLDLRDHIDEQFHFVSKDDQVVCTMEYIEHEQVNVIFVRIKRISSGKC
jgi:hypothetical protein